MDGMALDGNFITVPVFTTSHQRMSVPENVVTSSAFSTQYADKV